MTRDTLFNPERNSLRLKVIWPIYESLRTNEAASESLDTATPLSSSVAEANMFSFLRHETKNIS